MTSSFLSLGRLSAPPNPDSLPRPLLPDTEFNHDRIFNNGYNDIIGQGQLFCLPNIEIKCVQLKYLLPV